MNYLLLVTSRALEGRDDEYNRWYDTTHVVDVLGVPGFKACQRYVKADPGQSGVPVYVAAYEVETDDPAKLLETLYAATPNMQLTDSIDMESVKFEFLKPVGDLRKA